MRILGFFDLPTLTSADRREYTRFRKYLIKSGFLMLQESVYCKLTLNTTTADGVANAIHSHKPAAGLVQMLTITEKQFMRMQLILGEKKREVVDSDERLIIL